MLNSEKKYENNYRSRNKEVSVNSTGNNPDNKYYEMLSFNLAKKKVD